MIRQASGLRGTTAAEQKTNWKYLGFNDYGHWLRGRRILYGQLDCFDSGTNGL